MDKSPEAFRTISEVAEDMDLPQHVLRFWETRFPQIKPLKRGGGRRYYRPDDVELLRAIKELLYGEGYTIKGCRSCCASRAPPASSGARREGRAKGARLKPRRRARSSRAPRSRWARGRRQRAAAVERRPAEDVAALRAILTDLREAERILAQARAP